MMCRMARDDNPPAEARSAPWYLTDPQADVDERVGSTDTPGTATLEEALWAALSAAPDDGPISAS
jgi:hypothetical protein